MNWGRAAPLLGGALGCSMLLWAGLLLALLSLDVEISRDLAQLRDRQEELRGGVPRMWQRMEDLRGRVERDERDGRRTAVTAQRFGADVGQLRLEGRRLALEAAAQEAELRAELSRVGAAEGAGLPATTPHIGS